MSKKSLKKHTKRRSLKKQSAVVAAILLVVELGWLPSIQTGFYCDDPTIAYKYDGDTIRISMLIGVCTFAPLITIWFVEAGCCLCQGGAVVSGFRARARRGLKHAWVWYREYLLGLALGLLATDVAKVLVGEPRPHFLDSCKPDVMLAPGGCKAYATITGYVENFTCTNTELSHYVVRDSTKSFPSGHAALSVYSAVFLIWFLQRRMPGIPSSSPSLYLRPWLQCVCMVWAMAGSFTRISDHRHHAHDVLAGAILGIVIAILTIRNFCGGFWPGYCAFRLQEESASVGDSSGERGAPVMSPNGIANSDESRGQNGHTRNPHQSMRRLLSSTSSYSGSIANEENLREVTPA